MSRYTNQYKEDKKMIIDDKFVKQKLLKAQLATNYPEELALPRQTKIEGEAEGYLTILEAHLLTAFIVALLNEPADGEAAETETWINACQSLEEHLKHEIMTRCHLVQDDTFSVRPGFALYIKRGASPQDTPKHPFARFCSDMM
jgi:hypothetical protein